MLIPFTAIHDTVSVIQAFGFHLKNCINIDKLLFYTEIIHDNDSEQKQTKRNKCPFPIL